MSTLRVVLDTNVLVSGVGYPGGTPGRILNAWRENRFQAVLSDYILDEMVRVLPSLKRVLLSAEEIRKLRYAFRLRAEIVNPLAETDPALRDPADQPILGTLLAARADYLLTGDKDLLALADRYPILTPAAFWQRHGS